VARDRPEAHGQRRRAEGDDGDPDGAAEQQLLDVRLPDGEGPEGCRFGPVEEDKDGVELV
jgi:hypothetical protein